MINEELKNLYISYLPELKKMYQDLDSKAKNDKTVNHYTSPFLLSCWEEKYLASKYKLVIFGQETNGWPDDYLYADKDIEDTMKVYKDFELGSSYKSLFWRYAHEINLKVNGIDDLNFVWNNVNKFGKNYGKGRPHTEVLKNEIEHFNVLSQEMKILNPDICIFLTGPTYDADLKNKLPDLEIESFCGYPTNEVAKLKSKSLPNNSFRTYHPGYGNRYQEWYYEVIDYIINAIK